MKMIGIDSRTSSRTHRSILMPLILTRAGEMRRRSRTRWVIVQTMRKPPWTRMKTVLRGVSAHNEAEGRLTMRHSLYLCGSMEVVDLRKRIPQRQI